MVAAVASMYIMYVVDVWVLCEVASFDRGCVVFGYFCGWGVVVGFSLWLWVKRKRDCEEREREK